MKKKFFFLHFFCLIFFLNTYAQKLNPTQQNAIKQTLAVKVRHTIDNMQDTTLPLAKLYNLILTSAERTNINIDLNELYNYLTTDEWDSTHTFKYVPNPKDLNDSLFNADLSKSLPQTGGDLYNTNKDIYTNHLQHYLLKYLKTTKDADKIDNEVLDITYKNGWRELENLYATANRFQGLLKTALADCNPTDCKLDNNNELKAMCVAFEKLIDTNANQFNNTIIKLLKKDFFKKWLWYNEGFLLMNPIGATTADRRYPSNEKNSLLTDLLRNELMIDTLETERLEKFLITKQVHNEKLSKSVKNDNEIVEYDASKGYKLLNKDKLPKIKFNDKKIDVLVHNVKANETLQITTTDKVLSDMSAASQALIDATSIGSAKEIIDGIASWITAYGKISKQLNVTQPLINKSDIQTPTDVIATVITMNNTNTSRDNFKGLLNESVSFYKLNTYTQKNNGSKTDIQDNESFNNIFLDDLKDKQVTDEEFYVVINERKIAATKNQDIDKVNFINASFIKKGSKDCNSCNTIIDKCLIDSFILRDKCYAFDYLTKSLLDTNVNFLLARFRCYIQEINTCRNGLQKKYNLLTQTYVPNLKSILSIVQRSLPPINLEEKINDNPQLRTVVLSVQLPDAASKTVAYKVTTSNAAKRVEGKEPTAGASRDTVIQHSFKYVKRHYVDFSVGLAYKFGDYSLITPDATNPSGLPKVTEGERFQPIVGMHIYPLGLIKVNDKIWPPQWERLSLFFGLGFKNALENLYTGISYDVVPGIRVIGGKHFYKDTKYFINNNQVIDQASAFKESGFFISINLEPKTFASIIGLIK